MSEPASRRALVVDDDHAIRNLAAIVLRRAGFVVDSAMNGREALALLGADNPYTVILLDLMMPEVNGLEVIDELRVRDASALERVVVMTASVHLARHGLPEEIDHVLLKPFDLADFDAVITKCANGSGS